MKFYCRKDIATKKIKIKITGLFDSGQKGTFSLGKNNIWVVI